MKNSKVLNRSNHGTNNIAELKVLYTLYSYTSSSSSFEFLLRIAFVKKLSNILNKRFMNISMKKITRTNTEFACELVAP